MRPKSMILIAIALGCGLIASIAISQVIESRTAAPAATVPTEQIYVALIDVPLGQPLSAQMVKLEEWPQDKVPEGAVRKLEDLEGRMPLARLYPGEPILLAKLTDELNSASQQIPHGYRVCSVKVNMDSSASGLIKPGDHVDVLVTLSGRSTAIKQTETRTILQNVTVFAVNQYFQRGEDEKASIHAKTVSLLVKPEQVERVTLASELGRIKLALRRGDDAEQGSTTGATVYDLGTESDGETAQVAVQDAQLPGGAEDSITGILKGMKEFASAEDDTTNQQPSWVMHVHTPQNVQVYNWDDPHTLPRELTSATQASWPAAEPASQRDPVPTPGETKDDLLPEEEPELEPALELDEPLSVAS